MRSDHLLRRLVAPTVTALALSLSPTADAQKVWGSFDASRAASYRLLTGPESTEFRSMIECEGGTVAPLTSTLTPAYLSGVDVFFTSVLDLNKPVLSAAEQAALQAWVAQGGTLIAVTYVHGHAQLDAFTAPYGVTNYALGNSFVVAAPQAAHPVNEGVTKSYHLQAPTFTHTAGGRILVTPGDCVDDIGFDVYFVPAPQVPLSAAQAGWLADWVASGGTLITSAYFHYTSIDSYTAPFGVTGHWETSLTGDSVPTVAHAITAGLGTFHYEFNYGYSHGPDALSLAFDSQGNALMSVLESSTGFASGGRVLALGDTDLIEDDWVDTNVENAKLMQNIIDWAAATNYGAGWSGTNGVPGLSTVGAPILGESFAVQLGNSLGAPTTAVVLVGATSANTSTALGGTLLVNAIPAFAITLPLAAQGLTLPATLPAVPDHCGVHLYVQVLVSDPGASHGVAFSPGLDLHFGT